MAPGRRRRPARRGGERAADRRRARRAARRRRRALPAAAVGARPRRPRRRDFGEGRRRVPQLSTPTFALRRRFLKEQYQHELTRLYVEQLGFGDGETKDEEATEARRQSGSGITLRRRGRRGTATQPDWLSEWGGVSPAAGAADKAQRRRRTQRMGRVSAERRQRACYVVRIQHGKFCDIEFLIAHHTSHSHNVQRSALRPAAALGGLRLVVAHILVIDGGVDHAGGLRPIFSTSTFSAITSEHSARGGRRARCPRRGARQTPRWQRTRASRTVPSHWERRRLRR